MPVNDNDFYNAIYERGIREGERIGYRRGEMERVALATANSELRSQVRELTETVRYLESENAPARSLEDLVDYLAGGTR